MVSNQLLIIFFKLTTQKKPNHNECSLKITLNNNILSVSTEDGKNECGFGYAVRADANYILIDNFVPEYYTTGEDSKIYFESFYNEK